MNVFIAGTDTEIGKTTVTCGLLNALTQRGRRVAGMKPVAAGCNADGVNSDASTLLSHSCSGLRYEWVNPCLFHTPTAPRIAAEIEHRGLDWNAIANAYHTLTEIADVVIVEGVGGWRVPLSDELMASAIPQRFALPVILVAGIKLGAINHTLLTAEAVLQDGCEFRGWIANIIDPNYRYSAATIAELKRHLTVPCLGEIPWLRNPSSSVIAPWLTAGAAVIDDQRLLK